MTHTPNVSIIVPLFNNEDTIISTINSIINQTYKKWEIIIIDDGSQDQSIKLIEKHYSHINNIVQLKRNRFPKGASTCRNIGIESANGEFIIFLDADDLLTSGCIEYRIENMKQNPQLDFGVFSMQHFVKEPGDRSTLVNIFTDNESDYINNFLRYNIPWQTSCPIWKTLFLKKNHIKFSEEYQRLQDVEFHSKILLNYATNFKVFNSEVDCYYRQPSNIKTKVNEESLKKTIDSIILYYSEMHELTCKNEKKYLNKELDQFAINIFHSLLFYTRLPNTKQVKDLYNKLNSIRGLNRINRSIIVLFSFFNYTKLTFKKGLGISRLWNIINK